MIDTCVAASALRKSGARMSRIMASRAMRRWSCCRRQCTRGTMTPMTCSLPFLSEGLALRLIARLFKYLAGGLISRNIRSVGSFLQHQYRYIGLSQLKSKFRQQRHFPRQSLDINFPNIALLGELGRPPGAPCYFFLSSVKHML